MHYNISFPNLGIYLDHVGKSISIFGFSIAYYGMIIGAAILIGFLIATAEAKRTGQNPEDYLDMGLVGVIAGIAGARIYYVISPGLTASTGSLIANRQSVYSPNASLLKKFPQRPSI